MFLLEISKFYHCNNTIYS